MSKIALLFLVLAFHQLSFAQSLYDQEGALIRSDTLKKEIYLCFTGHDYFEGFEEVLGVLAQNGVQASFFLTGDFIRNQQSLTQKIDQQGHFVGAHSDKHLLYCDWNRRDSLLHSEAEIKQDILNNLSILNALKIYPDYFMPPYEWYNKQVVEIARELGQITVNFSPGTRSNADYTTPDMPNYLDSDTILKSIYDREDQSGLQGFHLLIHPGTSPLRKDKLYHHLDELIQELKNRGYSFRRF
ncbi:polysaccharide deacetylase family protein [Algoriphagus formosus]|uniref:Polysaccharide deacetylase family protein n=1 Tax=Algoriphagus formosus TaxID=2007308 RepID=A0A4R5V2P1_9BACT|nr:polysaccharide deacetylase family protein [Algoriphagus aquimaris]TDK46082.1 polysaccharide deacetylase family protein [Algoriphagus aquimaris]